MTYKSSLIATLAWTLPFSEQLSCETYCHLSVISCGCSLRTKFILVHTTMDENFSWYMWWGSWTQALILHRSEEVIAGKFWSRIDCLAAPPRALDCPTVIILALKCTHQCTPPPPSPSNASQFNEYICWYKFIYIWAKLDVPFLAVFKHPWQKVHLSKKRGGKRRVW